MKKRSLLLLAFTICFTFTLAQAQDPKPEVTRTADYVAKYISSNKAATENSLMYDNGSGVGVATSSPVATFDVNGTINAASGFNLGEEPFAFGSYANANAFFGFSGNSTMTGTANTADGWDALQDNTTGSWNTAVGGQALQVNTEGHSNSAVGLLALVANTTGNYNAALGNRSLEENSTGSFNIGIGYYGGQTLDGNPLTGSGDTAVGAGASFGSDSIGQATAIGNNAVVSESNALVLGCIEGENNCPATTLVGIATSTPSNLLTLGKGFGPAIADGWTTYSSRRWKTNIQTLQDALDKVEHLRGVSYDSKDGGKHQIGVIAEEVGAVVPEVVSWEKNGTDAAGVDYARLTAVLIEAVKEQQAQIEKLTHQVSAMQTALHQNEQGSTVLSASVGEPSVR